MESDCRRIRRGLSSRRAVTTRFTTHFRVFRAPPGGTVVVLQRLDRLAPEAGLEPATHRLTADCSTIELLWNCKWPANLQITLRTVNRVLSDSGPLATRTIEGASGGLNDSPNRRVANGARTARPIINQQSLLVEIRRTVGLTVIKQPPFTAPTCPVQSNRGAELKRLNQHLAEALSETFDPLAGQFARPQSRRNAGAKERLARVDIPHARDQ